MAYTPRSPPSVQTIEDLRLWVEDELRSLAVSINETTVVVLRPVYRAPTKPREGMLVYADGTSFNPGAGKGTYEYKAGAWVKL